MKTLQVRRTGTKTLRRGRSVSHPRRTVGAMGLATLLLPGRCPVCERAGPAPCRRCWAELRPAPAMPPPAGLDAAHALLAYEGAGRELLARLKYRNGRSVVPWLADGMTGLVAGAGTQIDTVTWAPTSRSRRRQRGFDQAEVLARATAARLGRPCRPLLVRAGGGPQTGRSREERRRGPSFAARAGAAGARLLLVDDVVTSGATLTAAASALRSAGAVSVLAVAAGRTPLKVLGPFADA